MFGAMTLYLKSGMKVARLGWSIMMMKGVTFMRLWMKERNKAITQDTVNDMENLQKYRCYHVRPGADVYEYHYFKTLDEAIIKMHCLIDHILLEEITELPGEGEVVDIVIKLEEYDKRHGDWVEVKADELSPVLDNVLVWKRTIKKILQ